MEIRKVVANDDYFAIGNIYAKSWKDTYKGILPDKYLDSLSARTWEEILKNNRYTSFVILEEEKYIGTSMVSPARDEKMKGFGEIISFYLKPEYFGKGYAKPLLDFVIKNLLQSHNQMYLWVLEQNERAQRFYIKNGFIATKDTMISEIAGQRLTELRYVLKT